MYAPPSRRPLKVERPAGRRRVHENVATKEFYGNLLLVAMILVIVPWIAFFWEACTGVTAAGRRSLGRVSTAQTLAASRNRAIGFTLLLGPVAILSYSAWKRKQ